MIYATDKLYEEYVLMEALPEKDEKGFSKVVQGKVFRFYTKNGEINIPDDLETNPEKYEEFLVKKEEK